MSRARAGASSRLVSAAEALCVLAAAGPSPSVPSVLPVSEWTAPAGLATPPGAGARGHQVARFDWPLIPQPAVSRPFQPPSQPYGPGHRGVDLVGFGGQPVRTAGDGVVVYAGPLAGRGVVSIDHADGLRTSYEPVHAAVRPGQVVHRGETIGSLDIGHPACRATACLHWGLRRDGRYLDPLLLVRAAHVRLLPWDEPGGRLNAR